MNPETFTDTITEVMTDTPDTTTKVLLGRTSAMQIAVLEGERSGTLLVASHDPEDNSYSQSPCHLTPYDGTGMHVTSTTATGPIEIDMYPSRNNDSRTGLVSYYEDESGSDATLDPVVLAVCQQNGADSGFREIPVATTHEFSQEGQGWKALQGEQSPLVLHPEVSQNAVTELEEYLVTEAAASLRENTRVGLYGVHNYPLSLVDLMRLPAAREVVSIVSEALRLPGTATISCNRTPPNAILSLHSDDTTQTVTNMTGQADFYVRDPLTEEVHCLNLKSGDVAYLQSGISHAVENTGDKDRWSLVISY